MTMDVIVDADDDMFAALYFYYDDVFTIINVMNMR